MDGQRTVKRATLLWAMAVGAGVAEAVLAVGGAAVSGRLGPAMVPEIAVHVGAYVTGGVLVVFFARGRNWARIALTVLLTGVGLASLVVPAAQELVGGAGLVEALGGSVPFALIRTVHIGCVVAASVVMYTPAANRVFTGRRAVVGSTA